MEHLPITKDAKWPNSQESRDRISYLCTQNLDGPKFVEWRQKQSLQDLYSWNLMVSNSLHSWIEFSWPLDFRDVATETCRSKRCLKSSQSMHTIKFLRMLMEHWIWEWPRVECKTKPRAYTCNLRAVDRRNHMHTQRGTHLSEKKRRALNMKVQNLAKRWNYITAFNNTSTHFWERAWLSTQHHSLCASWSRRLHKLPFHL